MGVISRSSQPIRYGLARLCNVIAAGTEVAEELDVRCLSIADHAKSAADLVPSLSSTMRFW